MKIIRFVSYDFQSNVFVLEDNLTNQVWLIDAGYSGELIKYLSYRKILNGIFLTHSHFDHISGLNKILEIFPNTKVYSKASSLEYLSNSEKNLSMFHGRPVAYSGNIVELNNHDIVNINDAESIKVYETPGHHPTCLTYIWRRCIFTGDAFIPGKKVITNLPDGDKQLAQLSFYKIVSLGLNKKIICPGHSIIQNI